MERKKLGAGLIALVAGIALLAGTASAQLGYLQGDPSRGKLVPYYEITSNSATIIGLENVYTAGSGVTSSDYIFVHVVIYDTVSTEVFDVTLCLSPYDFGFIILQQDPASGAQVAELGAKVLIASVTGDFIPSSGYVTLYVSAVANSCTGGTATGTTFDIQNSLAAWTVLQDVGTGFFATEIPTTTAGVGATGTISCGNLSNALTTGCGGLIAPNSWVIARYDINESVGSETSIYVWLNTNGAFVAGGTFSRSVSGWLQCEDELEVSTTIQLPHEVNVIDPATLGGVGQCIQAGQFRGVLRFQIPDTGFLWSHISQKGANFRMNFIGYNLSLNPYIP